MKSVIIYYSYSGNTRKVAEVLAEYLGNAAIIELKCLKEITSFIAQSRKAFWRKTAEIIDVKFDLKEYDLICFGTPVWAFGPAPAMNAYLEKCLGLEEKKVVLFATYGSGVGKNRCLNYMQEILTKKGASQLKRFFIQQFRVSEKDYILKQIKEIMPLSPNG